MRLHTKITLGFLAMLALLLGIGGYAYYTVGQLHHASRSILRDNFYSMQLGQAMLQVEDTLAANPAMLKVGQQLGFQRDAWYLTPGTVVHHVEILAHLYAKLSFVFFPVCSMRTERQPFVLKCLEACHLMDTTGGIDADRCTNQNKVMAIPPFCQREVVRRFQWRPVVPFCF